jgi:hypothetical protein
LDGGVHSSPSHATEAGATIIPVETVGKDEEGHSLAAPSRRLLSPWETAVWAQPDRASEIRPIREYGPPPQGRSLSHPNWHCGVCVSYLLPCEVAAALRGHLGLLEHLPCTFEVLGSAAGDAEKPVVLVTYSRGAVHTARLDVARNHGQGSLSTVGRPLSVLRQHAARVKELVDVDRPEILAGGRKQALLAKLGRDSSTAVGMFMF